VREGGREGGREKWDPPTSRPARGSGSNCPNPPAVRDHLLVEELGFLGREMIENSETVGNPNPLFIAQFLVDSKWRERERHTHTHTQEKCGSGHLEIRASLKINFVTISKRHVQMNIPIQHCSLFFYPL
jgi:hypothetical protein